MNVKEVLAAFSDPSESSEDSKTIWMMAIDQNNRIGYLFVNSEKHPAFSEILEAVSPFATDETLSRAAELLRADATLDADFSKRPRIEEVSPAMQNLFDEMESSDAITYFDLLDNCEWENLGLTREEYEKQIDTDIEKYGLGDIVVKDEDEDALYTCYGDFLCAFSKPGGKEKSISEESEAPEEISSLTPDGSNPMVSISFVPVDFQRDKEAPFRVCEIMDRSSQENPCVTYVVIRDGKDEALFTAAAGKGQQRDHAFFSALDYIADAYYSSPDLALENFDGAAYVKKYYEIALFSNPVTKLRYSPMALDSHWSRELSDYSTGKVFGDSLVNGELSVDTTKEIESMFNASLDSSTFRINAALLANIEEQPSISEVRVLENDTDITETPLFAAAQYEWEKERTGKIFDATEKELFVYLSALDTAMEKHGPTRATLDCYSEMLNDLCYGREEKLNEVSLPVSSTFGSSQNMESVYISCHKALKAFEQALKKEQANTFSV